MSEIFCKVPGCPEPGPYKNPRALGNHRTSKVHQGQKICEDCGEEYGYIGPHKKHCKGPEAGQVLHWETAEQWQEYEVIKAQAALLPVAQEDSARRLRNDRRFRKWLRKHDLGMPPDLEKQ